MAEITDLSDLINQLTGATAEHLFFWRDARVGEVAAGALTAGKINSLWQYNGIPSGGAIPTSVEIPTNSTPGALQQTNPSPGQEKWLLGITAAASGSSGTLIIYDRLLHIGQLSGSELGAQTVGGTLTRNADGIGNQIWIEIYTQIGATAATITASYTNQAGVTLCTTIPEQLGGTGYREIQRIIALPLASGDSGVRAVNSVTLSQSTGTAGAFGVSIVNPIAIIPLSIIGTGNVRDFISGLPSIIEIKHSACIALAWMSNTTSAVQIWGSFHFVSK
jgi:hypothetical protein